MTMSDAGYRLFKTTYKDRRGRTQEAAKWYIEFRDHLETVRRLPAFTSKTASEAMGRNPGEAGAAGKRLTDHLTDWGQALRARGCTETHVSLVTGRVGRIVTGCKFQFPADIAAGRVQSFLHDLRQGKEDKVGISAQT